MSKADIAPTALPLSRLSDQLRLTTRSLTAQAQMVGSCR
jgi:hypothetical protein